MAVLVSTHAFAEHQTLGLPVLLLVLMVLRCASSLCMCCVGMPALSPYADILLAGNSVTSHVPDLELVPRPVHGAMQENAGGVSRDEMAAVLMEVVDGRLPKDRIALRELYNEISGWPWLEADEDQTEGSGEAVADYEGITPTGTYGSACLQKGLVFDRPSSVCFCMHFAQIRMHFAMLTRRLCLQCSPATQCPSPELFMLCPHYVYDT